MRLFLASPGDVAYERQIAREVIDEVGSERAFRRRVDMDLIAWDKPGVGVPMEAGLTPQEAIARGLPEPAECDLVVVILWSRIGTPLPREYTKADGSRYLSGTEWEYENALTGFWAKRKPSVWVYRRTEEPKIGLRDPKRKEKEDQWEKLESFFASLTNPDGSLAGGKNSYDQPDHFRHQFAQHLRDWLTQRLQATGSNRSPLVPPVPAAETPAWIGPPYPGLKAFTEEQAPIFFGRGPEIDALVSRLADRKRRFLAVVGASGTGKSSLAMAGLLPRLHRGVIPGSREWVYLPRFTPALEESPLCGLGSALTGGCEGIAEPRWSLAARLGDTPECFGELAAAALDGRPDWAELLVFVDQFEELVTLVPEPERAPFVRVLEVMARTPRVRILVTLRADFAHRIDAWPALVAKLVEARLLVAEEKGRVEVAHEKLFDAWGRLRRWIDNSSDDLRLIEKVCLEAADWGRDRRARKHLWGHEKLQDVAAALERLGIERDELDPVCRDFIRPEAERLLAELEDIEIPHNRRAWIGDRLAEIGDSCPGIGAREDGAPDIDWVAIPGGEVELKADADRVRVEPFEMSRYLVTNARFQAFADAQDGYRRAEWWRDMPDDANDGPGKPRWPEPNCPRENVSWYEAVAFCRWLSRRLGHQVRLPTEDEWEQAASGGDAGSSYPWGPNWDARRCNTVESGLNRTSAVGLYPPGASAQGVLDLSGNLWELCLNQYEKPEKTAIDDSGESRVGRGGSWLYFRGLARAGDPLDPPRTTASSTTAFVWCVRPPSAERWTAGHWMLILCSLNRAPFLSTSGRAVGSAPRPVFSRFGL